MEVILKIKEELRKNNSKAALSLLLNCAQENPDLEKQIIMIRAQLSDFNNQQLSGVISTDDSWILSNKIRKSILDIVSQLETSGYLGKTSANDNIHYELDVIHNLPQPDYVSFVGREQELNEIIGLLSPRNRSWVITIDGIGGVGKSSLALEVADYYLNNSTSLAPNERFYSIIWISAKQSVLTGDGIVRKSNNFRILEDIFINIAITLNREDIITKSVKEQRILISKTLTKFRTLLIIDNLESIDDERVMEFIREIPSPTKVIVTTRHRVDVAYPVRLNGMNEDDALKLIQNESKRKKVELTLAQSKTLYERTGGIPLAIVWSLSQMAFGFEVETVLDKLNAPESDIIKFCFGELIQDIVAKPEYKLLLVLSLFSNSASRYAVGEVANLNEDVIIRDNALVSLEKLSLIDKKAGRFDMLPLTKVLSGIEFNKLGDEKEYYINRWIDYYLQLSLSRKETNKENLDELKDEYKNIEGVLNWLSSNNQDSRKLTAIVSNLQGFFLAREYWNDWRFWLDKAMEVAINQNDEVSLGINSYGLGLLSMLRREPIPARRYLERAYHILEENHIFLLASRAKLDLSRVYMFEGDYTKASNLLTKLEASLSNKDDLIELLVLLKIRYSELHTEIGCGFKKSDDLQKANLELEKAKKNLFKALEIIVDKEPTHGLNFIYWRLAVVFMEQDDHERALEYFSMSLDIANYLQLETGKAHTKKWLAVLLEKTGKLKQALEFAYDARESFFHLSMDSHVVEMSTLIQKINQRMEKN